MIFGIGLSRTGTTSLHHGLELLGIASAPTSVALLDDPEASILGRFEAFTDNPVPFMYRDLDARFPGSRFVLTTRPLEEWLDSVEWLFGPGLARLDRRTRRLGKRVHRELYGLRKFDESVMRGVYLRHHAEVEEHFADRPHDLLRIDLTDEATDPWGLLCPFLDRPRPSEDFPWSNGRADTAPPRSLR